MGNTTSNINRQQPVDIPSRADTMAHSTVRIHLIDPIYILHRQQMNQIMIQVRKLAT